MPSLPTARDSFWLRFGLAFIWLATGLAFLHPYYREVGANYLAYLNAPTWLMAVTCLFEVLLGLRLLLAPAGKLLILLQMAMIVAFTIILAWIEPPLAYDPFGVPMTAPVTVRPLGRQTNYGRKGRSARR